MKPVTFKVLHTGERFVCDDTRQVDVIDGIEYLFVYRPGEHRVFKMRKDVLVKDNAPVTQRN